MKKLLEDPDKFYKPKVRPSGHDIGKAFAKDNCMSYSLQLVANFQHQI